MRVHLTSRANAAESANVLGPMVLFMKENGRTTSEMVTANTLATNMSMLDNGPRI